MKNRSLASELILFILASVAAIFLTASMYSYYASKEGIVRRASENARHLSHETVFRIEVILRGVEKISLNLAAILEQLPRQEQNLVPLLRTVVSNNKELFGLGIGFEPYGHNPKSLYFCPYVFRSDDQLQVKMLGGESYRYFYLDWYQIPRELGRPLWIEPYFGAGNTIESTYSVPFYREREGRRRLAGVVSADISLMWLKDIVSAVKIYKTGYAFLISQNGMFVTYPEHRLIMRESIFGLAEAKKDPRIREVGREMIRGGEGFVPIPASLTGKRSWLYYAPVPGTGWSLGVVFPEAELFADAGRLMRRSAAVAVLSLIILAAVIIVISRGITRPLRHLARKTADIARGDFTAKVPETGAREIADLAGSFNRMGRELIDYMEKRDFIRDTFGRYVTPEVVKILLESKEALEMGGETREVSLLISDLRGFTALTSDMAPEDVIPFLNRYLGKMIEILVDYRAVIDEILGDGILAFFGAPEPLEDHPRRAVACALAMQEAMGDLNRLNQADGLPHLEMGIAVNTGTVVVGNIGSERRSKYSVVGSDVNFASRIESFALGGQVLISATTYERVKELVEVGDLLQAEMKGIPGKATLYEVRAIGAPYNIRIQTRSQALVRLASPMNIHLQRIQEKVVIGSNHEVQLTHLSETGVQVLLAGDLVEWEDVRLHLFERDGTPVPGKVYGKVTQVKVGADNSLTATIRFTSVSPEVYPIIQRTMNESAAE
ncbi:MAG: adenylate/guanylate cyclase domain-containing protein [Desulfobaccales bacterium]|jgi:sigma-B regulation protein RsbU (phosphoserine phosphatase)